MERSNVGQVFTLPWMKWQVENLPHKCGLHLPRRLHSLDEREVRRLGRVGMALETARLVVVRDRLLQFRERLKAAPDALTQFIPALGQGLCLGARRVEIAVGADL